MTAPIRVAGSTLAKPPEQRVAADGPGGPVEQAFTQSTICQQAQALSDANQTQLLLTLDREQLTWQLGETRKALAALGARLKAHGRTAITAPALPTDPAPTDPTPADPTP